MIEFLRCLLLSVDHASLLLPYSSIAEVISYQKPNKVDGFPEWLPGMIAWRGLQVPLIYFTTLTDTNQKLTNSHPQHIAILNRLFDTSDLSFIGLVVNKMPKMLRFKRSDITYTNHPNGQPYLLGEVMVREQNALIPNIPWIEKKTIEAIATIAGPVGQST